MRLVLVIASYALVLRELDEGFLVLLLGIFDSRTDQDCHAAVRLLLQMCYEFGLEHARDYRIAFFVRTRVDGEPVISEAR